MDLLKERLKRAPMNEVVPVQPTVKMSISPIQKVLEIEDAVYSDDENYNNMSNVLEESNHDQSLKKYSDNLLPRFVNILSYKTKNLIAIKHVHT